METKDWDAQAFDMQVDLAQVGPQGVTPPEGWPAQVSHNALHRALIAWDDANPTPTLAQHWATAELRAYLARNCGAQAAQIVDVLMPEMRATIGLDATERDTGMAQVLAGLVPLLQEQPARATLPQSDLDWIADAPPAKPGLFNIPVGVECHSIRVGVLKAYSEERDAAGLPMESLENASILILMLKIMDEPDAMKKSARILAPLLARGLTQDQYRASNRKLLAVLAARAEATETDHAQ